jgi:hypothetical protein
MPRAKDLDLTDELRKKIAEANEDALERLGLNPDTVETWEDGFRTADEQEEAFEWWYFDSQFDDGSACVITFSTKPHTRPKGPLVPEILIMTRSKDEKRRKETWSGEPSDLEASTDACDVRIGPSHVSGDLDDYELHAEAGGLTADLRIHREAPSWRPGASVTYLDPEKTKYFAWVVPVPYGTVEGTLGDESGERKVKGTVYHDHNWGNFLLSWMLDHWYWGRAHVGDYTAIFVQMVTAGIFGFGAVKLPTLYLADSERIITGDGFPLHLVTSDFVEGPGGRTYPTKLDFDWQTEEGRIHLKLRNPELIESIDTLSDVPSVLKPLVHLVLNPYYYDFLADFELDIDLEGIKARENGKALFEQMLFHKKASE